MNEVKERGRMFGVTATVTLSLGVAAAVFVIYHMQAPPPRIVQTPPEIKVLEKTVYAPAPKPAPLPPPPPVVVAKPPPPPEPSRTPVLVRREWNGLWRRKETPLPMFKLNQSESSVAGSCAPNWSAVLQFSGGTATEETVEFVVDDNVFRIHVRMTMLGQDKAKVENWVSDDDWLLSLARANRAARTPQQAILARAVLERSAKKLRKPVVVGIFTRSEE
jgi:hypothetical protein